MAVLVELVVPGATREKAYAIEEATQARGAAAGGPPYAGCMFLAATLDEAGLRIVSAWRREEDFRTVLATMLEPDLAAQGLAAEDVRVTPVLSMAIPGAH